MTKVQVDSNGKVITLGGKALVANEGGSATLITKNITQNGTYNASSDNADGYSSVSVNVSGTTPTGTLSITANGVYDVTNYASADVSVSSSGGGILTNASDWEDDYGGTFSDRRIKYFLVFKTDYDAGYLSDSGLKLLVVMPLDSDFKGPPQSYHSSFYVCDSTYESSGYCSFTNGASEMSYSTTIK